MFGNSSGNKEALSLYYMLSFKVLMRTNKANRLNKAPLVLQLIYKRRSTEISLKST